VADAAARLVREIRRSRQDPLSRIKYTGIELV
jgi:hypothetical protein